MNTIFIVLYSQATKLINPLKSPKPPI